jgi:S1-C subfamily serine protease
VDRRGVVVRDVVGLSPGIEAIANGDVVVEVNRQPTRDLESYRKMVATLPDGEVAWIFAYRPRPGGSFLAKLVVDRERVRK